MTHLFLFLHILPSNTKPAKQTNLSEVTIIASGSLSTTRISKLLLLSIPSPKRVSHKDGEYDVLALAVTERAP